MVAGVGVVALAAVGPEPEPEPVFVVSAAVAARQVVTNLMLEVVNCMDVALVAGRECYSGSKIAVRVVPDLLHATVTTRVAPTVLRIGM